MSNFFYNALRVKIKNIHDNTLKFPYTAKPKEHLKLLIDNLNLRDSGWQIGSYIDAEDKLISYSHNTCAEALTSIAEAYDTEYEIVGKTIHLHKVEHNKENPLPLSYGKGNGFKSGVGRTSEESRITKLYVQGGERNIDVSKYGHKELLLPKNKTFQYEGNTYVSDEKGFSISLQNAQNNGFINEQSVDLSHIYPKRVGITTKVTTDNLSKNFYSFYDTEIPADLDFTKYLIKGTEMTVIFESGMLSGREFGVKYSHNARRFEIVPSEQDGVTMPNETFKPEIGDKYALFNMQMPNQYISNDTQRTGASWELFKEACKHFFERQDDRFTFSGELDSIYAKKNWHNIGGRLILGGYVAFSDVEFHPTPTPIRIVGIREYINQPHSPMLELSNQAKGHSIMAELEKIKANEIAIKTHYDKAINYTNRTFRNSKQTIETLQEMFTNFSNGINPVTVETMGLLIGDKSLQFQFVNSKTAPQKVDLAIGFDSQTRQLKVGVAILQHLTLGIDTVQPTRTANAYKYWDIPAFTSGSLDTPSKKYNLYAKCSKTNQTGVFVLSETAIGVEDVTGYYHFCLGFLSSEENNKRSFGRIYGFTEILPGQMTLTRLSSSNGANFIELLDDRININAKVT